jgi:hypothetical protein
MTKLNEALFTRHGTEWDGKGTLDNFSKKGDSCTNFRHENCTRCGGTGIYRWFVRAQPAAGTCFKCNGARTTPAKARLYTAKKLATLDAAAQKREIKRAAAARLEAEAKAERVARKTTLWLSIDDNETVINAARNLTENQFATKMLDSLNDWGSLTDGQLGALKGTIAREKQNVASTFIGTIKERLDFTVTVERIMSFPGEWGTTYFNICRDGNGNVIVYKGIKVLAEKGEEVTFKATVKEHKAFNGTNQTIVNRPKVA